MADEPLCPFAGCETRTELCASCALLLRPEPDDLQAAVDGARSELVVPDVEMVRGWVTARRPVTLSFVNNVPREHS